MNGTNLLLTRFNLKSTESKIDYLFCDKVLRFYKNLFFYSSFEYASKSNSSIVYNYMNQWKFTVLLISQYSGALSIKAVMFCFWIFRMTKHDIREYLEKIYEVKVLKIRTYTIEGRKTLDCIQSIRDWR